MTQSHQSVPWPAAFCVLIVLALAPANLWGQPAQSASAETRTRAWDALRGVVHEQKYLNHSRAVEAIMRVFAIGKDDDKDEWGVAGLLHDIDISETANDLTRHGTVGARMLRNLGFSEPVVHAVSAHDDRAHVERTSRLDHAVYCADQVYWLIMATGVKFPSNEFQVAISKEIWEKAQSIPSKKALLPEITSECGGIGLSMPDAVERAHRALSQLASTPDFLKRKVGAR